MEDKFETALKQAGYSVTKPRKAVFSALRAGRPRSMRELTLDLESVIDRASIYRVVGLFERLGIVVRVKTGWKYKIELSDTFLPHHHHLTCTHCNKVISFDEPAGFGELLDKVASTNNFSADSHSLEIIGVCSDCQKLAKS